MARTTTTILRFAAAAATPLLPLSLAQGHQHGGAGSLQVPPAMGHGMGHGMADDMGHGMGAMSHSSDELSFLVHMIPHHQEAIDSARLLLAVTERAELQALATSIITAQGAEIAWMEAYLERWYPDAPREAHYEPMMRVLEAEASVAEIERAFLEDMIPHHMMAVHEARALLALGWAEREEVADLARTILSDQVSEIMLMRSWLASWFGGTPMGMMGAGHAGHGAAQGHGEAPHAHQRAAPAIDGAEAQRLAQAYLDGRGGGTALGAVAIPDGYAVVVQGADGLSLLIVDAETGGVRSAPTP
jgi:uncharacterized protein (DUF305 family)